MRKSIKTGRCVIVDLLKGDEYRPSAQFGLNLLACMFFLHVSRSISCRDLSGHGPERNCDLTSKDSTSPSDGLGCKGSTLPELSFRSYMYLVASMY